MGVRGFSTMAILRWSGESLPNAGRNPEVIPWGKPSRMRLREDIIQMVQVLYDTVGGRKHYASQPPEIKAICRGLRRDLILRRFPSVLHLRKYLESFSWKS